MPSVIMLHELFQVSKRVLPPTKQQKRKTWLSEQWNLNCNKTKLKVSQNLIINEQNIPEVKTNVYKAMRKDLRTYMVRNKTKTRYLYIYLNIFVCIRCLMILVLNNASCEWSSNCIFVDTTSSRRIIFYNADRLIVVPFLKLTCFSDLDNFSDFSQFVMFNAGYIFAGIRVDFGSCWFFTLD